MSFRKAVELCGRLEYCAGLEALGSERSRVESRNTRDITGSVNIEAAQHSISRNARTWDYGIGFRSVNHEVAVWVEVHSANSRHVGIILEKFASLEQFLCDHATALGAMPRRVIWLATDAVALPPNSAERRKLNQSGIQLHSRKVHLDRLFGKER